MKKRIFVLVMTIFILFTVNSAYSQNKPADIPEDVNVLPSGPTTIYPLLLIPAWILYPPMVESAVGIAFADPENPAKAADGTHNFAAMSMALNHGIFVFDTQDAIDYIDQLENVLSSFALEIKINPDSSYLNPETIKLISLAEAPVRDYELLLWGKDTVDINNDLVEASASSLPNWALSGATTEDDEFIYSVGQAEQPGLMDAWQLAQKNALNRLCLHKLTNLKATIQALDDPDAKKAVIEDIKHNSGSTFAKTWLFLKKVDGKTTYNVALMLKTKK